MLRTMRPIDGQPSVTVRIRGGIGNQLFMYAMARRLTIVNRVPLYLETGSGFADDFYRRIFELDKFNVVGERVALPPISKPRRGISMAANALLPFSLRRTYHDLWWKFNPGYLKLMVNRPIFLDGYWQDERYFEDIRSELKGDLTFRQSHSEANHKLALEMQSNESVAVHLRQLHCQPAGAQQVLPHVRNLPEEYYRTAIAKIKKRAKSPQVYLFSDKEEISPSFLNEEDVTRVRNKGEDSTYEDLWLMSQCHHFVLANSSFSWWGAWLGRSSDSMVVSPRVAEWALSSKLPKEWAAIEWSSRL